MFDMIESGYNFMKREHYNNNLPYAKYTKPNFVSSSGYNRRYNNNNINIINNNNKQQINNNQKRGEKLKSLITMFNTNVASFI